MPTGDAPTTSVINNFIAHKGATYIRGFTVQSIERDIANYCSLCVYVGVLLGCVMHVQFLYDVILHSFIINVNEMWFGVVSFCANHGQTD